MHHNLNTWGAYQAYGDPNYVLNTEKESGIDANQWTPVAPQELKSELKTLQINIKRSTLGRGQYTYVELVEYVDRILKRVPPDWVSKPGIQYILAELYGDMLPEGFERAEAACQQAIVHEDKEGQVPIRALELLGNLEARQAEKLSEQASDKWVESQQSGLDTGKKRELLAERERLLDHALRLSESAIKRLRGLLKITHEMHMLSGNEDGSRCEVNAERFALLGSALKRKAMVLVRHDNKGWNDILDTLEECSQFYAQGEGVSFDLNFNPYVTINRLQLDGVLGIGSSKHVELAQKARAAARQQFSQTLEFFDGVMAANAVVAIYLLSNDAFAGLRKEGQEAKAFLVDTFMDSVKGLNIQQRSFIQLPSSWKFCQFFWKNVLLQSRQAIRMKQKICLRSPKYYKSLLPF